MVLVPRCPDVQDVMCKHDASSGTAEAGVIVYLSGDKKVAKVAASGNVPFGMLGQRVKAQATGLPQNFEFPGEIGSSDARLGDPVLVYHGGQFDTTQYALPSGVTAGAALYASVATGNQGKLVDSILLASGVANGFSGSAQVVAVAESSLTVSEAAAGKSLLIKLLV